MWSSRSSRITIEYSLLQGTSHGDQKIDEKSTNHHPNSEKSEDHRKSPLSNQEDSSQMNSLERNPNADQNLDKNSEKSFQSPIFYPNHAKIIDSLDLPISILFSREIISEIFSMNTWNNLLTPSDRKYLSRFLPDQIPPETLLPDLFDFNKNFFFGNPLKQFIKNIKNGYYHEDLLPWNYQLGLMEKKCERLRWNLHFCELKEYLESYLGNGKICGNWGMESKNLAEIFEIEEKKVENLRARVHKVASKKRKRMERDKIVWKKKKAYWSFLEKEISKSDSEGSETDVDSEIADSAEDSDYEELTRKAKRHKQYKMQKKRKEAAAAVKDQPRKAPISDYPVFTLFTTLHSTFLENNMTTDTATLTNSLSQNLPLLMTIPPQYSTHSFVELALRFLAHPPRLPQQSGDIKCSPFVEVVEGGWKWKAGNTAGMKEKLQSLEQLFYFTATRKKLNPDETGKIPIPFSLIKQQKCKVTIPETTSYAVDLFRAQERERFENCNKPFVFDIQGVKSIVAPLKKYSHTSLKAREHILLLENRPGHINLLSLIRNAAARLPGGVGTRADVAQLMKDSQYVKSGSSDFKLNQVVSGALDRLQSAADPPVNYDPDQKLWIYLHRLRTEEDFGNEEEEEDLENAEEN